MNESDQRLAGGDDLDQARLEGFFDVIVEASRVASIEANRAVIERCETDRQNALFEVCPALREEPGGSSRSAVRVDAPSLPAWTRRLYERLRFPKSNNNHFAFQFVAISFLALFFILGVVAEPMIAVGGADGFSSRTSPGDGEQEPSTRSDIFARVFGPSRSVEAPNLAVATHDGLRRLNGVAAAVSEPLALPERSEVSMISLKLSEDTNGGRPAIIDTRERSALAGEFLGQPCQNAECGQAQTTSDSPSPTVETNLYNASTNHSTPFAICGELDGKGSVRCSVPVRSESTKSYRLSAPITLPMSKGAGGRSIAVSLRQIFQDDSTKLAATYSHKITSEVARPRRAQTESPTAVDELK